MRPKLRNSLTSEQALPMAKNPSKARSPLNVEEEYKKTLRTKSFVDMWAKVHQQLRQSALPPITPSLKDDDGNGGSNDTVDQIRLAARINVDHSSHGPSFNQYARLPDFLLDPSQETLLAAAAAADESSADRRVQSLLLEYFDATLQACTACADLLVSIDRARAHYRSIRLVLIKISDDRSSNNYDEFDELSCYVEQDNPLSPEHLRQFSNVQSCYGLLIEQLTLAHRRILRRLRVIRITKKAAGIVAIGTFSIAVAVAVLIAVHTVAGVGVVVAAVPVVVRTRPRATAASRWGKAVHESRLERLGARVDAAAKGAYIMGRDLETMSRMVRRAHDEVEHERDVARMVLRNREPQLVREVAREVEGGAAALAEQLQELEQHVHLCLITINRSRKLVAQEMMASSSEHLAPAPSVVVT